MTICHQLCNLLHQSMSLVYALWSSHLYNLKRQQLQTSFLDSSSIVSYLETLQYSAELRTPWAASPHCNSKQRRATLMRMMRAALLQHVKRQQLQSSFLESSNIVSYFEALQCSTALRTA